MIRNVNNNLFFFFKTRFQLKWKLFYLRSRHFFQNMDTEVSDAFDSRREKILKPNMIVALINITTLKGKQQTAQLHF